MKRIFGISFLLLIIIGAVFAYYEYNRKPANAGERKVDFKVTTNELYNEFENEDAATKKFLNKVIEIHGVVSAVEKNKNNYEVSFATNDPICAITVLMINEENSNASKIIPGDFVKLRGICNGKLSDIELNRGVIVKE